MKLITLSGKKLRRLGQPKFQFSLFSMAGTADIIKADPIELSDIDAGIWALYWINKFYPGITWGEIIEASQNKKIAGWLGDKLKDIGSFVGQGISDTGDKLADWSGDAIRLLTDKEVREGIVQYANAYEIGGQTSAIKSFMGQLGDLVPDKLKEGLLSKLGTNVKNAAAPQIIEGIENKYFYLGIGGGLLVLLLILTR